MNNLHMVHDISEIKAYVVDEKWNPYDQLRKNEIALLYILDGYGEVLNHEQRIDLRRGELLVIAQASEKLEQVVLNPLMPMNVFEIKYISASVCRAGGEWIVDEVKPQVRPNHSINKISHALISYHLNKLYHQWSNGCKTLIYDEPFLNHFKRVIANIDDVSNHHEDERVNLLADIKTYMDRHFEETIQVNEMIKASGLNLTTFYKEFKEYIGIPPLQYITSKRMEKAKHLLLSNTMKISDVSNEVGYQDVYYFSRLFKRTVGVSPRKFSQLCNRKIYVEAPVFIADLMALGISSNLFYPPQQSCPKRMLKTPRERDTCLKEMRLNNPDQIICRQCDELWIDQLREVAPISMIPYKNIDWRSRFLKISSEIGSENLALKWLHQYDKRLDILRKRVNNKIGNETILAIRVLEGKIRVFGDKRRKLSDFLYRELGLKAPACIQGIPYYDIHDSKELTHINAHHILLLTDPGTEGQTIKVKQQVSGNIYEVNSSPWLSYSALGHERVLMELKEILL